MDPSNKVWTEERSRRDKTPVEIQGGEIQAMIVPVLMLQHGIP